MTTEIAKRVEIPPATPQHSKLLSPQALAAHRQSIASEIRVVLSAYFQPHEDEAIRKAQLAWWCDELEDWTLENVVWSLRKWNRDNPRLRPTPGDIVAICKKARGQKIAAQLPKQEPAPERKPIDPDTAARIMAEAGFAPKRFGGDA